MAGLPYQLAAIFTSCPEYGAKLVHLTDILDLEHVPDSLQKQQHCRQHGTSYRQHHAADARQHGEDLTLWEPAGWAAMGAAVGDVREITSRNPLTARYLAALLTKELAERCEILK